MQLSKTTTSEIFKSKNIYMKPCREEQDSLVFANFAYANVNSESSSIVLILKGKDAWPLFYCTSPQCLWSQQCTNEYL
jgi:hypothetical protein